MTHAPNTGLLHKKIEAIIEGGLKNYSIKDVCVIVWSMCAINYNQSGGFWENLEAFLYEELNRKRQLEMQGADENTVNLLSWILWAYLNNRELSFKTVDLMSSIILEKLDAVPTALSN